MDEYDLRIAISERLKAYILPNKASTHFQIESFWRAVDAQMQFELEQQSSEIPAGAVAYSIGNYSVTFGSNGGEGYSAEAISPTAKAILRNAGLLKKSLPCARRW